MVQRLYWLSAYLALFCSLLTLRSRCHQSKSDNVLLMSAGTDDMVPKVADFSISARKGAAGGLTSAGTPAYMAPEVARGELVQDWEAVDCYGFGCIVHDTAHANTGGPGVVLGEADISSTRLNGIQVLIKREMAGYERVISPHVPAALAALASACLSVSPAARPRLAMARVQLAGMQQDANTW
jgi:serine/threonine protein kinase